MECLKKFIKNNTNFAISFPALISFTDFMCNLLTAISDGQLDGAQFHQLLSSANGIESFILIVIMIALKEKKK